MSQLLHRTIPRPSSRVFKIPNSIPTSRPIIRSHRSTLLRHSSSSTSPIKSSSGPLISLALVGTVGLVGLVFGISALNSHGYKHEKDQSGAKIEVTSHVAKRVERGDEEVDQPSNEESQQSAFNPDTGEINWDCPCLGGMAHGVCGEEFKLAFSCFVYSENEPKGVECIEKFKLMQDCFQQHPDIYGEELMGKEEGDQPSQRDEEEVNKDGEDEARSLIPPTTSPLSNPTDLNTSHHHPNLPHSEVFISDSQPQIITSDKSESNPPATTS